MTCVSTTARPISSRRRRAATSPTSPCPAADVRGGAHSRRRLPRPAGRVLRPDDAAALHDAGGRRSSRRPSAATASATASRVVLYSIGSMMWATRFWWMLRSLGFDGAAVLDGGFDKWKAEGRPIESGAARGYPPATFTADAATGTVRRQARRCSPPSAKPEHRDRQRARPPVPQGPGAQPLRPAGPRSPAASTCRPPPWSIPRRKGFTTLADAAAKFAAQGVTQGQARHLLLRRRHFGHHRPVPAAPARLRRPHALRRLHGRVGEGHDRCRSSGAERRRQPPARISSRRRTKKSRFVRNRSFAGSNSTALLPQSTARSITLRCQQAMAPRSNSR